MVNGEWKWPDLLCHPWTADYTGSPVTIQAHDPVQDRELRPDIQRMAGLLPEHFDADRARLESIMEKHG